MNDRTLTLNTSGPDPSDLSAKSGDDISISNNTEASVVLTLDNAGVFNPSQGTSLTVPTTGWSGKIGNTSSDYSYPIASLDAATRNGKITVGN